MKSTWREINNVLGKGKRANIPDKCYDEQQVFSSSTDIAGAFNSYFTNIGETLANTVPSTNAHFMDYLHNTNTSSLFLIPTNPYEITEIVEKLNSDTSCGFDDVRSSVVKSVISFISHHLAYIFNISFLTGSVPSNLKIAKVTPVFKSGDPEDIHNYRPISVLPCFSKILERLVYNRLSKFLAKFNIIYDYQFGFRTKHSTDMARIHLTDLISNSLCDKLCTAGVFIDLSKAFDTIDHNILLSKLDFYGVRGCALQWFKNYLDSRQQFTVINNCKSVRTYISHGVPQGSILGPLLFLLYVNDLHSSSSLLSFLLFADDTTIIYSSPNYDSFVYTLNCELIKVSSWFKSNKLSLNSSKTKCIFFSKSSNPSFPSSAIAIDNSPISRVKSTKFLGVIVDEKLSWTEHISSVTKTISRNTGALSKLRSFLPPPILFSIYNTLILPYINYCNIVWARSSTNHLHSLTLIQKRAIRICTLSYPRDHTAPLFARLGTLTVSDINKLHTGIFMYKY